MKSTVFKSIYEEDDATYPSLADMSRKSSREHRLNFIAVNHDVGSTVFRRNTPQYKKYSFGCPRFFFRFSFTRAIVNVPMANVDWCKFSATDYFRTCFMGTLSNREWQEGPRYHSTISPFVTLDDVLPSRYVMAYRHNNNVNNNLTIGFVSIDPERVGEATADGIVVDFGDNATRYLRKFKSAAAATVDKTTLFMSSDMIKYLNLKLDMTI